MHGYMGKILSINLSNGEIDLECFGEDFARSLLGGNGFAVKLIYDLVPTMAEPLSEDNVVVFASGPFSGTPVWGAGRGHLASLSPLTGIFFDSNFGGDFASMMKMTGFDVIVVSGKASSPVYVSIRDDEVSLKSADDLWERSTGETHRLLREREGNGIESAVIGPAGERGVLYANVICSGSRISAAGRGGIGAVLGSKRLKGIAVSGTREVDTADHDRLIEYLQNLFYDLREKTQALSSIGTPVLIKMINERGKLGTHNNRRETFSGADAISGELISERYKQKNTACQGCPIACGKLVAVPHGDFGGRIVKMPSYGTLYSLGSMLDNDDVVSIFNGSAMCDAMGMDTISFGVSLAFLAECFERGIVTERDLGMGVSFGEFEHLSAIVKKTALREGAIGKLLSVGSERMAEQIGHHSDQFLYTVKGLEIAGHSARGLRHMGLGYATGTRGGSHHDTRPIYYATDPEIDPGFEHQPEYCINSQHNTAIGDSLVMCRFLHERAFGAHLSNSIIPLVQHVTGWDIDLEELKTIGERIYNLERIINVNRGINRSKDTLPYRVMNEPIPDGPSQGWCCSREELDGMLDRYYRLRGWDERGIPTDSKIVELGLR
jgi:aldehyde:ferredoxin oxidoreductase